MFKKLTEFCNNVQVFHPLYLMLYLGLCNCVGHIFVFVFFVHANYNNEYADNQILSTRAICSTIKFYVICDGIT